jgi:hypothetical protein
MKESDDANCKWKNNRNPWQKGHWLTVLALAFPGISLCQGYFCQVLRLISSEQAGSQTGDR